MPIRAFTKNGMMEEINSIYLTLFVVFVWVQNLCPCHNSNLWQYTFKLRGYLVRFYLLNYIINCIVAYVNRIGYSKKGRNRDNPQPSP